MSCLLCRETPLHKSHNEFFPILFNLTAMKQRKNIVRHAMAESHDSAKINKAYEIIKYNFKI